MLNKEYNDPESRLQGWNAYIQQVLGPFIPEATWFLFGLAGLDSGLIRKERELLAKYKDPTHADLSIKERTDHNTFSILWVFGAYEVVRTMHQRLRRHASVAVQNSELCFRIGDLKARFERVRIPLAKFETPARFPTDSGVAIPGIDFDKGATWFVTPTEHITRRELSDSLLEILTRWSDWIQKPHTP